jgi:hypothetical protein
LHAAAACLSGDDCGSIDLGIARKAPLTPTTALYPAGLDGGRPVCGSGKSVIPCARMHSDIRSSCAFACAEA